MNIFGNYVYKYIFISLNKSKVYETLVLLKTKLNVYCSFYHFSQNDKYDLCSEEDVPRLLNVFSTC